MDIKELNNVRKLRKYLKNEPSSVLLEVIEKLTVVYEEVLEKEQTEAAEREKQIELLAEQRKAILDSGVDINALMNALAQDAAPQKTRKPRKPRTENTTEPQQSTADNNAQ